MTLLSACDREASQIKAELNPKSAGGQEDQGTHLLYGLELGPEWGHPWDACGPLLQGLHQMRPVMAAKRKRFWAKVGRYTTSSSSTARAPVRLDALEDGRHR